MSNNSLNGYATNAEELSQKYGGSNTPGVNDSLDDISVALGLGADVPTQTVHNGYNISLGDVQTWAIDVTNWDGYRRMRNVGSYDPTALGQYFIAHRSDTLTIYALRDSTEIRKNGTVQTTINAGNSTSFSVVSEDQIYCSRPVNVRSSRYDLGCTYMGWGGYAFATRRSRNSPASLVITAVAGEANYEVLYTTSYGLQTSLTSQTSGTISQQYDNTAAISISSTRNYFIVADAPIACYIYYVAGGGMADTLQLYPMDQDDKFGAFSSGGHMFLTNNASQNRAGSNVTQQLFNRSSNGGSTTERNASSASPSVYTDISPGQTSGTFFTGPVQKVSPGNGCLVAAEQQADGNGSEKTPFVSTKAFGKATIMTSAADWATCIGNAALTVYRRDSNGILLGTQTMTGNATYNVYFTRFTGLSAGDVLEITSGGMIVYSDNDTTYDDERENIMSDVTMEVPYEAVNIAVDQWGDPSQACADGPSGTFVEVYAVPSFTTGCALYTNTACTSKVVDVYGADYYYEGNDNIAFQLDSNSKLINIAGCR